MGYILSSRLKRRGLVAIGLHLGETLANNEGSPIEAAVHSAITKDSGVHCCESHRNVLCRGVHL